MGLTPDQLGAARACGCVLRPATDDQVRRFAMQRRVFRIDGQPFVATRGGLFETHGTLAALIEGRVPRAGDAVAEAAPIQEVAPTPPPEVSGRKETSTLAVGAPAAEVAPLERKGRRAAAPKPRKASTPPEMAPASTAPAANGEAAAEPSEAADMLAAVEASQPRGSGTRVVGRRRAGEPKAPRWATAGKARRGRLN